MGIVFVKSVREKSTGQPIARDRWNVGLGDFSLGFEKGSDFLIINLLLLTILYCQRRSGRFQGVLVLDFTAFEIEYALSYIGQDEIRGFGGIIPPRWFPFGHKDVQFIPTEDFWDYEGEKLSLKVRRGIILDETYPAFKYLLYYLGRGQRGFATQAPVPRLLNSAVLYKEGEPTKENLEKEIEDRLEINQELKKAIGEN